MLEKIFSQIKYRISDFSGKPWDEVKSTSEHLEAALRWFSNCLLPDGGSAAKYSLVSHSFTAGYPMSTANWVPVLSRIRQYYPEVYNKVMKGDELIRELVNWVLRTQRRDGTFPASYGDFMNQPPRVFNNGMIINSLLDYHNVQGDAAILEACVNSAEWLLEVQSPDGSWRQFTFHQLSSNTITASALIRLSHITGISKYREAGEKNIRFAKDLQLPNGYFKGNGIDSNSSAVTITIGYAIAGLLEAGILSGNREWINAAIKGLGPVLNKINANGFLAGDLDEGFHSTSSYTCLPGNCLVALSAYKLATLEGDNKYRHSADLLTDYVKSKQLHSGTPETDGGIPGSWPISGNYSSYEITSWGVRYFCEALMMQDSFRV